MHQPRPSFKNTTKPLTLSLSLSHTHTYTHTHTNMGFFRCLSISAFLLKGFFFTVTYGATFQIQNNCLYTVWAAASPGGGMRLNQGDTWTINVPPGTTGARIWARTDCSFNAAGVGMCQTGDCNGLLECQAYGAAPNTLAEYALNQVNNVDFFDISLVDGFNVPMEFGPTTSGCTRGIKCRADISGQCPEELKAPGGCNNPCTVFKTDQYCCTSGKCGPTSYSKFFKDRCPDAYSYPQDDQTSTFTCPGGTNYKVVFCPFFWYGVMVC
ncbi:thaumatin-like protein [Cornus florida]|uniref:thaumatin-like protein n=1 Tax=Cornus florida TaxID=4283 RepID=UPI00289ECEFB|nr:thaumatin-like protein [Cornus florida]